MNLFQPKPMTYQKFDDKQERVITRFPLQTPCARIERLEPLWEELAKDGKSEF